MLCDNLAIKVDNISKCFESFDTPRNRLKNLLFNTSTGKSEFWALKDISFEVKKGETVGIIGRNGAGKSTLLQILCGTLQQTLGDVQVNGKVAALLELGAGFNPDFTGRENIYLNASILGLSKNEIDAVYDSIVEFSELSEFINNPVKTYSSGMYVRLGFAVAAHTNADILIIDEALSVGDVFFQQKCMRFLTEFKEKGGTLLFVSHDTSSVLSLCEKAVILYPKASKPCVKGSSEDICKLYVNELYLEKKENYIETQKHDEKAHHESKGEIIGIQQPKEIYKIGSFRKHAESFGEKGAEIVDSYFIKENKITSEMTSDEKIKLVMEVRCYKNILNPAAGFMIKDNKGQYLYTEGSDLAFRHKKLLFKKNEHIKFEFEFEMPVLIRGSYTVNLAFAEGIGDNHIQHHWIHDAFEIEVLQGRVVHGCCGLNRLNTKIVWISNEEQ